VTALAPVFAAFADGDIVGTTKPLAVGLNPIHYVGRPGISLNPAPFTPFIDFYLFDLNFHIVGHMTFFSFDSFCKLTVSKA
jgi:hypothetical protein